MTKDRILDQSKYRYWLFGAPSYEASGGLDDCLGIFPSIDELISGIQNSRGTFSWIEILDITTMDTYFFGIDKLDTFTIAKIKMRLEKEDNSGNFLKRMRR
ncbi:MAG: hypothetical protein HXS54_06290 [Theionarchaea archaeon]|nr:hypothetical protein [Theionarchaea archaeon]DBA34868.1 TPA_asm: hypothetical protein vir521_00074 [Caudoviricetes sp. vir521]